MDNYEMKTKLPDLVSPGFFLPSWMLVVCICVMPLAAQETSEPLSVAQPEPVDRANYPNVLIDVSSRFVSAGITVPLNSCDPIRDCIVGASISGTGQTIGNMTASLGSNPNHAAIQLNVKGNTYTRTVGTQRKVKFWSKGVIPFTAQRTLMFDKYGFTGSLVTGCAWSDNRTYCVSAPRLIQRAASRQVQKSKPQADREIAQHTVPTVRKQLQEDSQKVIDKANAAYNENFRQPLEAIGRFPQSLSFSTLNNELQVSLLKAAEGQVGADVPAPAFDLQHDIGLRIHESAFNNFAESLLGGLTLTDEELRTDVAMFLALIKHKEYEPHGDSDDWSVTFAEQKPITAAFRDGHYQIVISGQKWTSGEWEVDALDVTVRFKIEQSESAVKLVRDGEIKIEPPKPLPMLQRAKLAIAKRVMASKFNHLFPEEIEAKGLVVPGPWAKVGAMPVAKMVATDGWLEVSWVMPQQSARVMSMPSSTPTPIATPVLTTN